MNADELVEYLSGLPRWKLRVCSILATLSVLVERDLRYFVVTLPRATARRFLRDLHSGLGDLDQSPL